MGILKFIHSHIQTKTKIGDEWDKLSPSKEDAIEFAHTNINPEPERYITPFKYSLEYQLAHYGESINQRYRKDCPDKDDLEISKIVAAHTTKVPLVLYRGVCKEVFRQMMENAEGMENVDLYEKSFLQTSLVKGQETNSYYHLRIYVPSGTQAIYLGNVNDEQLFYEVDIQRGAKLKIYSRDKEYINCILMEHENVISTENDTPSTQ